MDEFSAQDELYKVLAEYIERNYTLYVNEKMRDQAKEVCIKHILEHVLNIKPHE